MSTHFFDLDREQLRSFVVEHGLRRFVADQLQEWVYQRGVTELDRMTNVSRRDRERLGELVHFESARLLTERRASDGTRKLLLGWTGPTVESTGSGLPLLEPSSGGETECVMIPAGDRRTACISSQVGCPVGCRFCASGLEGLEGNLTRGNIVEQAWRLGRMAGVGRITNVVFMGMGEPLVNFPGVVGAIRTLNASWGLGIGARRITVSTVGLPAGIRRLARFELPVTLALSLHAPNDELRRQIIPWADRSTIEELLEACTEYFRESGREVTLEYILLGGVNDRPEHARELAGLARSLRANVNLIRYNEVEGLPYRRPVSADVHRFQALLRERGVNVHIRASRGRDIDAACGQLRHQHRREQG